VHTLPAVALPDASADHNTPQDSYLQALTLCAVILQVAYETIAAGDVLRQQTFLTHPWIVREVTTGTRLLLNGREAIVPTSQEHREQVAAARARQQAAQQQAQQQAQQHEAGVQDNHNQLQQQQQQQDGVQIGGVGPGGQLVVLAGLGAGWPLFEVTVGELPQLQWTVSGYDVLRWCWCWCQQVHLAS
jgi:hypothetical protein